MKKFSWKFATFAFLSIIVLDAVLEFLTLLGPEHESWWEWLIGIPFWLINFPGFPLLHYLRASSDGTVIAILALPVCLLSAFLWSVVAGFFFGHKYAA